ncbi:MAG TPA: CopG family antitoxin [Anaerolineae bacterium]|nr:CopG family antitoxin [Anaerolineae bacterium]
MAKIPDFATLEEAIEFWDSHSFADYVDDTEPVEIEVNLEHGRQVVSLQLDTERSEKLRALARREGKSPTELAAEWLVERLEREQSA